MNNNFINKVNHPLNKSEDGFTLIELTAVVVILGILGSLGIGNINRWMKLSKIDQATSLLSNSLVECLSSTRGGKDPLSVGPPNDVIDNNRLESSGYKIKDSKDKCSEFFITAINTDEKVLFEMGYQITADNEVTKIATPADSQSSLTRCKRWAGPNCGASEEQKAAWAAAAALAARKKECNDNFYSWLSDTPPNGGTGSFKRWDSTAEDCTSIAYAFEGSIVPDQAAVDAAQEAKLGAICNAAVIAQKSLNPPPSGITTLSECTGKTFYFCLGEDKQTETAMNTCMAENKEKVCISKREEARLNNHKGQYGPHTGPGTCGEIYYMCDQVQLTSKSDYDESSCAGSEQGPNAAKCLKASPAHQREGIVRFCKGAGGDEAVPGHPYCGSFDKCMSGD